MSVEFEEQEELSSFKSRAVLGAATTPGMVQFLKNKNIVKDEQSAGRLLWIIIIACFVVAFLIVLYALGVFSPLFAKNSPTNPIPYAEWKNLPKSFQDKIPHGPIQ